MALKGNQGTLHEDVRTFLDDPQTELSVSASTVDGDHGRIETRTGHALDRDFMAAGRPSLAGSGRIGKVIRVRERPRRRGGREALTRVGPAMPPRKPGLAARRAHSA